MKNISIILATTLFFTAPLNFAGKISLVAECDPNSVGEENSQCDNYEYKTNPDLFDAQNFAFNKSKYGNGYSIQGHIFSLPDSKGLKSFDNCGFIMTGNEKIECPLENDMKYSSEYDTYLAVHFQLSSKTCRCVGIKVPFS